MIGKLLIAMCVAMSVSAASDRTDKPSPVPHRPVRPAFDAHRTVRTSQPSLKKTDAETSSRNRLADRTSQMNSDTRETGMACFFGSAASGAVTASGAVLDHTERVAAHPSFPLGAWIRVKNLANGKTADVQIVDRFPGGGSRVINVSEAAAKDLDFVKAGTAQVELTPVLDHAR